MTTDATDCNKSKDKNRHQIDPRTARSETVRTLREGPVTGDELPSEQLPSASSPLREYVCRLKIPARSGETTRRDIPPSRPVYYLYGDERRAARKFAAVNEAFARQAIDGEHRLLDGLDDVMQQLIREEWVFREAEQELEDEDEELRADGGLVRACPECDHAQIVYIVGNGKYGNPEHDKNYRCDNCGHAFDEPVEREPQNTQGLKGLARRLDEIDADDVGTPRPEPGTRVGGAD